METSDLVEQVCVDPELHPQERETILRFHMDTKCFVLSSRVPVIVRRTLTHRGADILRYYTEHAPSRGKQNVHDIGEGEEIYGIRAKIPVRYLRIKGEPRTNDNFSTIM